jgi:hypothetical protein
LAPPGKRRASQRCEALRPFRPRPPIRAAQRLRNGRVPTSCRLHRATSPGRHVARADGWESRGVVPEHCSTRTSVAQSSRQRTNTFLPGCHASACWSKDVRTLRLAVARPTRRTSSPIKPRGTEPHARRREPSSPDERPRGEPEWRKALCAAHPTGGHQAATFSGTASNGAICASLSSLYVPMIRHVPCSSRWTVSTRDSRSTTHA